MVSLPYDLSLVCVSFAISLQIYLVSRTSSVYICRTAVLYSALDRWPNITSTLHATPTFATNHYTTTLTTFVTPFIHLVNYKILSSVLSTHSHICHLNWQPKKCAGVHPETEDRDHQESSPDRRCTRRFTRCSPTASLTGKQ